jgi:hypothetical protein
MEKAADETITWIWLDDAKAMVTEVYQSPEIAKRFLRQELAADRIRWRGQDSPLKSGKLGLDPGSGDPKFWKAVTRVNWPENWAIHEVAETRPTLGRNWMRSGSEITRRQDRFILRQYSMLRIEVAREDVVRRLSEAAGVDLDAILAPVAPEIPSLVTSTIRLDGPEVERVKEYLSTAFPPHGIPDTSTPDARKVARRKIKQVMKAAKADPAKRDSIDRALGIRK